jgi:hypothetical protein
MPDKGIRMNARSSTDRTKKVNMRYTIPSLSRSFPTKLEHLLILRSVRKQ